MCLITLTRRSGGRTNSTRTFTFWRGKPFGLPAWSLRPSLCQEKTSFEVTEHNGSTCMEKVNSVETTAGLESESNEMALALDPIFKQVLGEESQKRENDLPSTYKVFISFPDFLIFFKYSQLPPSPISSILSYIFLEGLNCWAVLCFCFI